MLTVSGRLIVPPNNLVESEPNDAIAQAQSVTSTSVVSGQATQTDSGLSLPGTGGIIVQDVYRLSAAGPVRVTLTIADDDPTINDLDLFLMDTAGNVLDSSEGSIATELVETTAAGEFLVGVRAFQGASAYVLAFAALGALTSTTVEDLPPGAAFVPGELLVKLHPAAVATRQVGGELAARHGLWRIQSFPSGVVLMQITTEAQEAVVRQAYQKQTGGVPHAGHTQDDKLLKTLTLDRLRQLRADPAVLYAEPNYLRWPLAISNDAFFDLQWHYTVINLPQAWDVTLGDNDIIVAVIDTGVVLSHPDLNTRLIAGFDFISNVVQANDGNGIDSDASDPGDDPDGESSSFHGTHVAGTVGALTNNSTGVAGVTWLTRIMPLRVLGVGGGTDADIAQAIRYAAGLSPIRPALLRRSQRILSI